MKFTLKIFLFCLLQICFLSRTDAQTKINQGEIIQEKIKFLDFNQSLVTVTIPADTCVLLYRYRGKNWLSETKDSIEKVERIVKDLLHTSRSFNHLRVICYSYNQDNFLTASNKPVFKTDKDYRVEYYFLSERFPSKVTQNEKLVLLNKKGKVLAASAFIDGFKYVHQPEIRKLKAKIMTEKNGTKIPLMNAAVYLFSNSAKDTLSIAKTDKYGDFELNIPENSQDQTLRVEPVQKNIKTVILATQEGVEKMRIIRNVTLFEYKLIPADVIRLSDMEVDDDILMAFNNFIATKEQEFRKSENINYKTGSYSIEENSKKILDKIATILAENSGIRLEVISHTDSQGDDKSNMELSEKRSLSVVSYLILIGVQQDRLTYTGKGETELRNRCKNGVDCSDKEHGYNRRTEFRFLKK